MNTPNPTQDISVALDLKSHRHRLGMRVWLAIAAVVVLAVLGYLYLKSNGSEKQPRFQTEKVGRGDLTVTVSATGNLQPTNQVDVGSELSGIIDAVYVDENDHVKKGQVLARLDVAKLQDAVSKSRATLASAQAQVLQMQATVAESRATLGRLKQVAELSGGKVPAKSEMDTAVANVQRAEANEASAKAAVVQAEADLKSNETNLSKASLRSPINGVVLTRKVEPGQTVAASLQAPVLFTLAEDLSKMELHVNVDEADVGQVRPGQPASFTVDAWPNRRYPAQIVRVDYGSQITDQVVSYLAVLKVDNPDLSLRPGMTATAEITTAMLKDVLLVPNAALRFTPVSTQPERASGGGGLVGAMLPHFPHRGAAQRPAKPKQSGMQRVWVLRNGHPAAVDVEVGLTNGQMTEVTGGALQAGMQVITDTLSTPAK
jgi:HlyD family secretion protein